MFFPIALRLAIVLASVLGVTTANAVDDDHGSNGGISPAPQSGSDLEAAAPGDGGAGRAMSPPVGTAHPTIGIRFQDIDEVTRMRESLPSAIEGALVTAVDAHSPAAIAGIASGDVITEVAGIRVGSAESALRAIRAKAGIELRLQIWRGGAMRPVVVHPRIAR